jgi:hypothetical protein
MPTAKHAAIRFLRMKYQIAHDAHQSCVRALNEAGMSGQLPSAQLLEREAKAARELAEASRNLLAEMRKP